jgi:hypothetical protein
MAMETGTHSPWVSRLLTALGYEVIVGHAQKVRLITTVRPSHDGVQELSGVVSNPFVKPSIQSQSATISSRGF